MAPAQLSMELTVIPRRKSVAQLSYCATVLLRKRLFAQTSSGANDRSRKCLCANGIFIPLRKWNCANINHPQAREGCLAFALWGGGGCDERQSYEASHRGAALTERVRDAEHLRRDARVLARRRSAVLRPRVVHAAHLHERHARVVLPAADGTLSPDTATGRGPEHIMGHPRVRLVRR